MREMRNNERLAAGGVGAESEGLCCGRAMANGELITMSLRNHESPLEPANLASNTSGSLRRPWSGLGSVWSHHPQPDGGRLFSPLDPTPPDG